MKFVRLIKFDNVIANMDEVVMIKGKNSGTVSVYVYTTTGDDIYLGECENRSDYEQFVQTLYDGLLGQFPDEVVSFNTYDDELWS